MAAVDAGTEHHLVKVTNLGVGYPQADGSIKKVVDDVSFHVDRGEILGIVGESGSGKSQTAFSILGLLPDNARIVAGSIQFDGNYTVAPGEERVSQERLSKLRGKRISYIPQEPMSNLDPAFTIGYQLVTPMMRVLGISKEEASTRALKLLTDVGIVNPKRTFDAYPHEVSGGMAQRVLIAGAISCEPDLVIADEPTTALDVTVQADVLDLIRDLQKRLNIGVILVTHNFGVVADLCDRVVVMQNGRLVEEGPVRDILRNPQETYTRTLLGSMLEGKEPMTMLVSSTCQKAAMSATVTSAPPAAGSAPLLRVDNLIVEYPGKKFRAKPFRALTDINITIGRARPSAWWGSPVPAKPPWAAPSWGWRRLRRAGSRSTARTSATPAARTGGP